MIKKSNYFPKVDISRSDNMIEGAAGIELKSVLMADLLNNRISGINDKHISPESRLHPKVQQDSRVALLHAISSWPANVILELHMTSYPNLQNRQQSYLWITLFIKTIADNEEKVKEELLKRYLSLMPLLSAHLPDYEFEPITSDKVLSKILRPFEPRYALSLTRKKESISLSTPIKRLSIGFGHITSIERNGENDVDHCFPFIPSADSGERLINTIMGQLNQVQIVIRIKKSADDEEILNNLKENIRKCEEFLSSSKEYMITLNRQAGMIRDISLNQLASISDISFDIAAIIFAPDPIDRSLGNVFGRSITESVPDEGEKFLFKGGFSLKDIATELASNSLYFSEKNVSLGETASVFRLPAPPLSNLPGLPIKRARTSQAVIRSEFFPKDNTVELFHNVHIGTTQPIFVKADERMRHTFIIGQTGTGKSTLMEFMIMQDIMKNQGLAVIDPHGDMIDSILGKIPQKRQKDVILFDVLDRDYPLGFNILEWSTIDERDLIIDEIYTIIDYLYDMRVSGGPIFESNFRSMLKLLMGDRKQNDFTPTILNFINCYLDKDFRGWLKNRIDDSILLDFIQELERTGGDASLKNLSPYVTSKLGRFTNDSTLMRIFGQEKTSFDFDDIINNGKIFLVKLGKGCFGSQVSSLLANMLVSRFKYAAMRRGNLPISDRKDFYLYVDECHNLPSENFTELLSEARKYRMGLILATQYTAQLSSRYEKNSFLSAVIGNVGTIIAFRLGQEDAKVMSSVFQPYFSTLDIIGLPNWKGYTRIQQGVDVIPPFSFQACKDETIFKGIVADKIKVFSRSIYGTKKEIVDTRLREQRNKWKEPEIDNGEEDGDD